MAPVTHNARLYVIATTEAGTAQALVEARRHVATAANIVLIVPVIVPNGHRTAETTALMDQYDAAAARAGVPAPYLVVCQQPQDALAGFPIAGATLIIGDTAEDDRTVSPERSLARLLAHEGHRVILAQADGARPIDRSE